MSNFVDDLKEKAKKKYPGFWESDQGADLNELIDQAVIAVCEEIGDSLANPSYVKETIRVAATYKRLDDATGQCKDKVKC